MNKRLICVLVAIALAIPLFSEAYISANDLESAALKANQSYEDNFTILANDKKGVTIEAMDVAREAKDGEVFNARIKLNGSGKMDYRAITMVAKKGETITIYMNSSSKTDVRTLALAKADGTVLTTLSAPIDNDKDAGMESYTAAEDGTYTIYSTGSGINIYAISIE